jgi:RNA polymerase sigma-70 factor, ECF subfamily
MSVSGPTGKLHAHDRLAAETFLTSLYAQHRTKLLAYVKRMTSDQHLAEEIVQETMLRAWRNAEVLGRQSGSTWGWLSKVARNITVDHIRRKAVRPKEVEDTLASPRRGSTVDHSDQVVNSLDVAAALARLNPAHRDVLRELYFADRTCAEAARVLGVPVGTVKSRLFYALRQLRQDLELQTSKQERRERQDRPYPCAA